MGFPSGMGENVGGMFSKSHGVNIRVPVERESAIFRKQMASDAANRATADGGKALPADEKEKGLKLFEIVNQSMKRLRRVKAGRVTKP